MNNQELAQALIKLGKEVEVSEEEANVYLPRVGEPEDRSFYIPNVGLGFYDPGYARLRDLLPTMRRR